MALIYNATFDKNTRKLSFEDRAGNEIYSFIVPERGPAVDDITKPLTLKATQDGSVVRLEKYHSPSGAFQTSVDGGNTWTDYTLGSRITLNTGDEVSFRAKADRSPYQYASDYFYFVMAGKIEAWHNVMSLYRTNDFSTCDTAVGSLFAYLFDGCTSLVKAPVLPATTLNDSCYYHMFDGCQSLTKAPELPATTLAQNCYGSMFRGCQSLTEAPVLPATTLANCYYCYQYMFDGCQSLTEAPALPATTLVQNCYQYMFRGCQSLTEAPALPATTLVQNCYQYMFRGCQSLTKAPELPATTLANGCYFGMFAGCGSLNEVRCQMPSTISAGDIPTYTGDGSDTTKPAWLSNVASTGTFYTNADANWPSGASGIPQNWNRVNVDDITKPLTFRATQDGSTVTLKISGHPSGSFQTSRDGGNTWEDYTLNTAIPLNTGDKVSFRAKADRSSNQNASDYFSFQMTGKIEAWHNVMSLYLTNDFATLFYLGSYAFKSLFKGCTSLTKPPALPATALNIYCYSNMFNGCQSLTEAPVLPAKGLVHNCYAYMFSGCQSLKEVRISAIETATNALTDWLKGVSATGDFYCDPNATIFPSGASGIPANWNRHALADYPTT